MADEKKLKEEQIKENGNEQREMTQEELDKIVGGYIPGQPWTQETLQYMTCPKCDTTLINLDSSLDSSVLFCPNCGRKLN